MDEQALQVLLQQVLAEHYGQSDGSFHSLNTRSLDDERIVYKMYRVDLRDHSSWVICAAHEDLIASHTFQWERQETACTWLLERASVLTALTAQSYPAPHVVPTRTNAAVVRSGPWSVLVTTWIAGHNSQFQPAPLSQAGALLARLHMLPLEVMPERPARWNSAYSIPHAIKALEGVRASIPASHDAFSRECSGTLRAVLDALPGVPDVFIHAGSWMQNVVCTSHGMVFIDWESAGCGAAILDLADFLFRSQCDTYGAPPDALLPAHVTAAASGYASERLPNEHELDLLALAARFSCVWPAAWMLTRVLVEGWTPRLEQRLTHAAATYELAEPSARLARSAFQEFQTFPS
jgi:Ser/Thr protein kinase RdoA (MazF antagonist)